MKITPFAQEAEAILKTSRESAAPPALGSFALLKVLSRARGLAGGSLGCDSSRCGS